MDRKFIPIVSMILIVAMFLIGCQYSLSPSSPPSDDPPANKDFEFNQQSACYFIDGKTTSDLHITGQSTFALVGSLPANTNNTSYTTDFKGHMEVAAYPLSSPDAFQYITGSVDDTFITLSCQGLALVETESNIWYTVQILRSSPHVCVITIWQKGQTSSIAKAVCGTSETDALNNYAKYIESMQAIGS